MKWYWIVLIGIGVLAIIIYFVWKNKQSNNQSKSAKAWENCAKNWETSPRAGGPGYTSGDLSLEQTCGKQPINASKEGLMCNWTGYNDNGALSSGIGIIKNGKCELRNI